MEFKEFVLSKVIWKDTEHFDKLIEAASQIEKAPYKYLENHLSSSKISKLYHKIFDLTIKPHQSTVNKYLWSLYQPNTRLCKDCKNIKPLSEFYLKNDSENGIKQYMTQCKKCRVIANKIRKDNIFLEYFKELACHICGYSDCREALDFHHLNPLEKEYLVSKMINYSKEKILNELSKGILVCANCHREIHAGMHPEFLIQNSVETDNN